MSATQRENGRKPTFICSANYFKLVAGIRWGVISCYTMEVNGSHLFFDFQWTEQSSFRLSSSHDVVNFIKKYISETEQERIDLAFISVLLGLIEHRLTAASRGESDKANGENGENSFPVISSDDILPLVEDFHRYIRKTIKPKTSSVAGIAFTDRQTIKNVATAVWKCLNKKSIPRDKAHCQSLYTFKNGGRLDAFGLAIAVVAGCQVIGCNDVHLCLSEQHAWVTFGPNGTETADVTWQGMQKEISRGEPIDGQLLGQGWLYLGGNPVICFSRRMEIAAAVAMIDPSIDTKRHSNILKNLQRDLMWMLYDADCYSRYPMALCVLTELQKSLGPSGRPDADELFYQAIDCSRSFYGDKHVYPYIQYGNYFYGKGLFDQALFRWQQAANVLRKYFYSRSEDVLNKEFQVVAGELIPSAFKLLTESDSTSFFEMTENFVNFILFYDGIAEWEENGRTPLFHTFWARWFTNSVNYFPSTIRLPVLSSPVANESIVTAELPRSPVKNVEAYRKSLLAIVVNVYGSSAEGDGNEETADDFLAMCEKSKLKADLVWNPVLVSRKKAEKPVTRRLHLRSRKMQALRPFLTKNLIRSLDIDLQMCAQVDSYSAGSSSQGGSNDGRRVSERKRKQMG